LRFWVPAASSSEEREVFGEVLGVKEGEREEEGEGGRE
jgi:hypothetical protein